MPIKTSNNFIRVIFLFISVIFFACNESSEHKTTINFWAMGSEAENLNRIVAKFEDDNPGIKIIVQQIPWSAAQEKLITAYASDNTPDACQLGNTWVPQFVALNAIENLNSWIESSKVIKRKNYFKGIWDTNVIDSSTYGIPWYIDTRVLFYRTDILSKAGYNHPPETWQQLFDAAKKIKELYDGDKNRFGIFLPSNEWAPAVIFGLQNHAKLLTENNTRANFNSEKFKDAFSYLIKFYKSKLSPFGVSQVTNVYQAFKENYFAMYISGPWNIKEFKKWMTGKLKDKWMTAALPSPDNNYPGVSLAGGSSLVMFHQSKHKNEVWKFFEFLSHPKNQVKFYKLTDDLPAVRAAWNDSTLMNDPYMKAFYKQFQKVVAMPKIPELEQIVSSKLIQYLEYAARDVMSVDEALKNLDKDADRILEKRRWLLNKK